MCLSATVKHFHFNFSSGSPSLSRISLHSPGELGSLKKRQRKKNKKKKEKSLHSLIVVFVVVVAVVCSVCFRFGSFLRSLSSFVLSVSLSCFPETHYHSTFSFFILPRFCWVLCLLLFFFVVISFKFDTDRIVSTAEQQQALLSLTRLALVLSHTHSSILSVFLFVWLCFQDSKQQFSNVELQSVQHELLGGQSSRSLFWLYSLTNTGDWHFTKPSNPTKRVPT